MYLAGWLDVCPIVAILRGIRPQEAEPICAVLEREGIAIVEVPLNSPNALESVEILSRVFGDRMLIGAGTVTKAAQVAEVAARGGRLIVTPIADLAIVDASKQARLITIPGFFNPTEAFALLEAGADAIKLFPSEVLGIPMLKALKPLLPETAKIIPVGGINAENVQEWMTAGAAGVGVGTSIYVPGDSEAKVQVKARALMATITPHLRSGAKT